MLPWFTQRADGGSGHVIEDPFPEDTPDCPESVLIHQVEALCVGKGGEEEDVSNGDPVLYMRVALVKGLVGSCPPLQLTNRFIKDVPCIDGGAKGDPEVRV